MGADRGWRNHNVASEDVTSSSSVCRCGHAFTRGDVAGPSLRFLWRCWGHLCNGRVHTIRRGPNAHFQQAYAYHIIYL